MSVQQMRCASVQEWPQSDAVWGHGEHLAAMHQQLAPDQTLELRHSLLAVLMVRAQLQEVSSRVRSPQLRWCSARLHDSASWGSGKE